MPDYKTRDPKGWCGDPKRGAAMGRHDLLDADPSEPIVLTLRPIRFVDGDYDVNGTYWGSGEPLFWYADEAGEVDAVVRAATREAAIQEVREKYPLATFDDVRTYAGEDERDEFVVGYAEAALWADLRDDDGNEIDGKQVDDIAPESWAKMVADCNAFREKAASLLILAPISEAQAGYDFWMSRQGHGVGFQDRVPGDLGRKLADIARTFREQYLFTDHIDGSSDKVHVE